MRVVSLLLTELLLASSATASGASRFALVAGNNVGAPGRPKLWFAEKDAERFGRALVELGGFDGDQVLVLQGGTPSSFRDALRAFGRQLAARRRSGESSLLVVYYSGHAGSGGLEMRGERLGFDELRELVVATPADMKVAIVDACEAGLLTQVKGALPAPALNFPLPAVDGVEGTAFIASTAVGEAAQESAAIGGSFFTHHLEAALRGAGDADGDGLVTLAEAFRYTAAQTISGTTATEHGPQHPTYDFKMAGRGDVVLADLRRAEARLRIPISPGASYLLRGPRGLLVELAGASRELLLAMPAGSYQVERRNDLGRARASFDLQRGAVTHLPPLSPTRYEMARAKGGPKPGLIFAGVGAGSVGLASFGIAPVARVGVRKELGSIGLRLRLDSMHKNVVDRDLRYSFSWTGGQLALLWPVNVSRVLIEAGPEIGYAYAAQRLPDRRSFSSGVLAAGAALLVTAPLGVVRVGLDASAGVHGMRLNESRTLRPAVSIATLVLYGF